MNIKERYSKYSLVGIILILGTVLLFKMAPSLSGILGACTIYILVRKQMFFLTEKKRIKRHFAATLLLFETLLCFLIPLSLVIWLFVNKLQNINLDPQTYISEINNLADLIHKKTSYNILNNENITFITSLLPKIGQFIAGNIGSFIANVFVMLLVLFFMLIEGRKMEQYFYDLLPFTKRDKKSVLAKINTIVRANAIGIPLVAIIQGGVATIGFFIFNSPNPILFGFLSCFASIIPIVGVGLIWAPIIGYLALTGDWQNAIGLGLYSLIFTTNIDNLIRFILQKKLANTHPLITLFGVFIGLSVFGFLGIIFGPLMVAIFLLCIDIFKKEYLEKESKSEKES